VYAPTKSEVLEKLKELGDVRGLRKEARRLTVGEFIDRYLELAKDRLSPTTFARYGELARIHIKPVIGSIRLAALDDLQIESFYARLAERGASKWTRKMAGRFLGTALKHAVRRKIIRFDPSASVEKVKTDEREMLFLSSDQVRQFLESAKDNRLYALFAVALATGMRQGELLGLKWGDIDFDAATITVRRSLAQAKGEFILKEPKSKSSKRTIAVPAFALEALKSHRAAMLKEGNIGAQVFCTSTGNFIGKSNLIRKVFQPILKRANAAAVQRAAKLSTAGNSVEPALLPSIRFHDLRHSHATMLLRAGHNLKAVSVRLGHAKPEITLRVYSHVLPLDDAQLAAGLQKMLG
jgi:integrase